MKNASVFLVVSVLTLSGLQNAYSFSGQGSGTEQDPYIITNVAQLQEMNNDLDAWYELGNDIDASDTINWNGGEGFVPIGNETDNFNGNFDGQGYSITDLFISRSFTSYQGLFGYVSGRNIQNVGLINVYISGDMYVGGLVGNYGGGTINNSYSVGTIISGNSNNYVGGLVGYGSGTISNSYSISTVSGQNFVGGLAGEFYGTMSNCYSISTVIGTANQIGGLIGQGGTISNSYSNSNVTGNDSVGGLVGRYGTITNSYATGTVNGHFYIGGLEGYNVYLIDNSHATGDVIGSADIGGLVGYSSGLIDNSYSTGNVSGGFNQAGLVGENRGTISNSYATGNVNGHGYNYVGGLVGYGGGVISNSYATGNVHGSQEIGGLAGLCGTISNSYATGNVSGTKDVGGLVGQYSYGTIVNSYSTGNVSGDYSGGLTGTYFIEGGISTNSYWDINTSGQTLSAGGEGKTTAEMKQIGTFTNWDFVDAWGIEDNQTYPFLKLTYPVGDLNHDKVVNFLDFAILAEHWLEGI